MWRDAMAMATTATSPTATRISEPTSADVPVEEAVQAAVEVEERGATEEPVAFARVRQVLERLAVPAQLRDELLGLAGVHAIVELAVRDQERDGDVVDPVHRRTRVDLRGGEERGAHHPLHVLAAFAVAHGP